MAPTGTFHGRGGAKLDPFKFLDPKMPVRRFERAVPGDLLHLDIKKLAKFDQPDHGVTGDYKVNRRGAGWERAYVRIDDHTRRAYVKVLPNDRGETAATFLAREIEQFQKMGVTVIQVMTDNGSCYRSKVFGKTCERFNTRHPFTRPYSGKA